MATITEDRSAVRLDDGRTFSVAGSIDHVAQDGAGFTITYRKPRRAGTIVERHAAADGHILWWSYGPPHAVVSDDGHAVVLPGGARADFSAARVVSVTAFEDGFVVTIADPNRTGVAHTSLSRRNVKYLGPDGVLRWSVGEPDGVRAVSYHGVAVEPDGSLWALASGGMLMARVDPRTGAVDELRPYK